MESRGFDLNTWAEGVAFAEVEEELEKEQVEGGGKSGFGVGTCQAWVAH